MGMRFLALTAVVMVAFAANSILNRLALAEGDISPALFAVIRLASGALVLSVLVTLRGGRLSFSRRLVGAGSLALYMVGFSFAYVSLDAGLGALILFGGVQITMFAGAEATGEKMPPRRWAGAGVAFAGLVWLLWPAGAAAPDAGGALLMAAAALGWGVYSLVGRGETDPLSSTAANFVLALPVTIFAMAVAGIGAGASEKGIAAAITSGAVTSGLGYALWYAVLPKLQASQAALAQLTVPVAALVGGTALLGEVPTLRTLLAGTVVLAGVALGAFSRR